jgi:hypothetical protein
MSAATKATRSTVSKKSDSNARLGCLGFKLDLEPGARRDHDMVAVALSLGVLHAIESLLWAIVYVWLGALPSPADAALYSVDSMTTRGASGLQLDRQWRMMGATEAGDGMLLFGISTAFLFYVMQRLWMQRLLKSDFHGTS